MTPLQAYVRANPLVSRRELADALGIKALGYLQDMIKGRRNMSVRVAKALANLTGRPWAEIYDDSQVQERRG